jgi:hypothetical protein
MYADRLLNHFPIEGHNEVFLIAHFFSPGTFPTAEKWGEREEWLTMNDDCSCSCQAVLLPLCVYAALMCHDPLPDSRLGWKREELC